MKKTTTKQQGKAKATRSGYAVESLSWDSAGAPVWTTQSEHSSHDKAKEAMEMLHKDRKDVSLRIRHTGKTTASVTTSSDAGKLRRAAPEADANTATDAKPAGKKGASAKKAPVETTNGKMSALDAAAKVLAEAKAPMNTKEMIEAMAAKGLWSSPGGKTPWATLYSAILRELTTKGKDARFKKAERGKFTATGK